MGPRRKLEDWDLTKPGGRLAFARASRGIGRAALAPHADMALETLRGIERGTIASAPYELARLYAVACDVDITWLVDGGPAPDLPRLFRYDPASSTSAQWRYVQKRLEEAGPRSTWPRYKEVEPEGGPQARSPLGSTGKRRIRGMAAEVGGQAAEDRARPEIAEPKTRAP